MKPGGTIWLSGERKGENVVVRVRDTGVGIAADLLPHIFDLFTQADRSLDRSQGGLGIGLTMVLRLTQLHGGRVTAFSAGLGQGSEFVVCLPGTGLPQPEGDSQETDRSPVSLPNLAPDRAARSPRLASNAVRVLVVDDNVDAAETLAQLLQIWGCDVQVVHDGPAAIETAIAWVPTLILLDIGLPGMNGYEVAVRLREQDCLRNTALIAVTGYGQEEDRRLARAARLDDHLIKPVDPEALQRLIAEASAARTLSC
jgi:CheY-like chemotaxis protein